MAAPSSPTHCDQSTPNRPTMERKPKLTYYGKQKAERGVLRCQQAELTKLLQQLQIRKKAMVRAVSYQPAKSVWREVAARGLKDRQASEELHRLLLSAVSDKNVMVNDLIALVRHHMRMLSPIATQSQGLYCDTILQPNDELLYAMYIHELDGVYKQTDQVFKECGMVSSDESAASQRALTTEQGTPIVEIGWKQVFPFGYRQTCDAMWMLSNLVLHPQDSREVFEDVEGPENTVAAKVRFTRKVDGGGCESLVHRFVRRRLVEEDREVSVWKSSIRGDGSFRGLQVQGTGWSVFRRSADGSGTVNLTCTRHTSLHLCSGNKVPGTLAKQFDEFVQRIVRENYQEITKMAESLLLDDALNEIKM